MKTLSFLLLLALFSCKPSDKNIQIDDYFQSGMIIQQGEPILVWGTALADSKIIAHLGNEKQVTRCDKSGKWEVTFSAHQGSYETLTLSVNDKEISDILVGEVWLCSGQSNMAMSLNSCKTKIQDINTTQFDKIRIYNQTILKIVAKNGYTPKELERCNTEKLFKKQWTMVDSTSFKRQSAVAWHFASNLQATLDMPVGIVMAAVGGSAINSWIPASIAKNAPLTKSLYTKDWLTNEDVYINHRNRMREAFAPVLPETGDYIVGKTPYRFLCEPDVLFEASLAKLKKVKFKGAVWYQGEGDAYSANSIKRYEALLPLMINSWRTHFDDAQLPFIIVQLPKHKEETWPWMREVQRKVASETSHTSLLTIIDLGEYKNIHPKNKQPVGARLSNVALHDVYHIDSPVSPTLRSWKLQDNKITLKLNDIGDNIIIKDGQSGFKVAGEDGQFVEAAVKLNSDNTIEISSTVASPKHLHYLWEAFPEATVFNANNLPLGPISLDL